MTRKEAELTRAEETIRREQQQIQEMRQRVSLVCPIMKIETILTYYLITRGNPPINMVDWSCIYVKDVLLSNSYDILILYQDVVYVL